MTKPVNVTKSETEIQNDILKYLSALNVFYKRDRNQNVYSKGGNMIFRQSEVPGWPDIVGLLPNGRFFGIEVKSSTGRQSPEQKQTQIDIEANGGLYILARCIQDVNILAVLLKDMPPATPSRSLALKLSAWHKKHIG